MADGLSGGRTEPGPYPASVSSSIAALVPVKHFATGKSRLDGALDDDARAALAERLARGVVKAAAPIPVFVACEDDRVAAWAETQGAAVLRSEEVGLNRVIRHGVAKLAALGFERVLVAHADLADPRNLPALARWDGVVLVPDRSLDGTNVVIVPTNAGFRFSYGVGSFARHLSEAERVAAPLHVIEDAGLALDLDEPADLAAYDASMASGIKSTPVER